MLLINVDLLERGDGEDGVELVLAFALLATVQDLQHHQDREQGQDSHGQDMRQRPQLLELAIVFAHGVGGFVRNNSDVSGVILRQSK